MGMGIGKCLSLNLFQNSPLLFRLFLEILNFLYQRLELTFELLIHDLGKLEILLRHLTVALE